MRPTSSYPWCMRHLKLAMMLAIVAVSFAMALSAAPLMAAENTVRLRIMWGGPAPERWTGRVSLSEGELSGLSLLGRDRDAPGSIWLEEGEIRFAQPRPRTFDGFDITASASLAASIRFELRAEGDESPDMVEAGLSDLMVQQHRSALGGGKATLLAYRAADDALRIQVERDEVIFSPGETLGFSLEPAIAGLELGSSLDVTAELLRGRRGEREWSNTQRLSLPVRGAARFPLEIPLPDREGVYTVKLTARTPPGNRVPFWNNANSEQLAERSFQVVVLGTEPPERFRAATWQTVVEIDPANPRWWNRLADWTRFDRWAGLGSAPMGSEEFRTFDWNALTLAELTPSRPDSPSWQAYPLPAAQPGEPHVVEVDFPSDVEQKVAIRVYEANATGKVVPVGIAGGVEVGAPVASGKSSDIKSYRYLFWPRTKSPMVVVQNASTITPARFGKIRLRVARGSVAPVDTDFENRMVAAYFDWESLLQRCSVVAPSPTGAAVSHDWQTFYLAANRLATLLELSGYNAAVVNVFADGGAAFDTGTYPTVPQLNSSRLASGTDDLPAIDPFELMLRVFERRGLRLIPSLRFTGSLPNVEKNLRSGQYRTVDNYPVWTDPSGRPRLRVEPDGPPGPPHYNVAHADVANEIRQVIRTLTSRSKDSEAFAGVAVELSRDSYLCSPPAHYGITRSGLEKLASATDASRAVFDSWIEQPARLLQNSSSRRQWNAMRAARITGFFEKLTSDINEQRPNAPLLLLTSETLEGREFEVRPQLSTTTPIEELLLERGIAAAQLDRLEKVHVSTVRHVTTGLPLEDAAASLEFNARAARTDASATPRPVVIWHQSSKVAEPQPGETKQQVQRQSSVTFDRLAEQLPSDLLDAMYDDTEGPIIFGGPTGPSGAASTSLQNCLRLVSRLPAESETHAVFEQPVAARVYRTPDRAVAVAVNSSPWEVSATITLGVGARTTAVAMSTESTSDSNSASYASGTHAWTVTLPPYSAHALEFDDNDISVAGIRVALGSDATEQLAERCRELERRDLKPDQLEPYSGATNPSFEETDAAGMAVGWVAADGVPTVTPGYDGDRAAQLTSNGVTRLATKPFLVPPTGQIAVTVYVKAVDVSKDAQLRLIIEEKDSILPRYVTLSGERLMRDKQDLREKKSDEWNAYQFGVEDLPLDSSAKMQVRVELTGEGEVWIDHIQLHALVYPLEIYTDESAQHVLALVQHVKKTRKAFEQRQYRECLRLLDSYWSRYLLEYLPEIESPPVDAVAPATPATPTDSEQEAPRLGERLRNLLRF